MDEERVKWSKILLVDKSDGSSTSRDRHPPILCILLSYFFLLFSCSFVLDGGQRERGCMEKRTDVREKRQIYIYIYVYIQWLGVEDLEFCNFEFEISLSRIVNCFRKICS